MFYTVEIISNLWSLDFCKRFVRVLFLWSINLFWISYVYGVI